MYVLTLVFVILAACMLVAAAQDSLCVGRAWGIHSRVHQEDCIQALNVPILLSSLAIVALLVWSSWGRQIAI